MKLTKVIYPVQILKIPHRKHTKTLMKIFKTMKKKMKFSSPKKIPMKFGLEIPKEK